MLKDNYLIEKRNVLNEIRSNNMTLQELRFFSIYLARINPRNIESRVVRFALVDFEKIMELGSRVRIDYLKHVTDSLLCKVVKVPTERGGYDSFQLFKRCKVDLDDTGEWFIEIDAHDEALPLMFEFKEKYFTYALWNALKLKSANQLRMYEILKQYERIGERIISIAELKDLLGIAKKEYPLYNNFKVHVLDVCQQALRENTDIRFEYEPSGKRGKGGKILHLKFTIGKNVSYVDQLTLDEFIERQIEADEPEVSGFDKERIEFLADACNNEFSGAETQVLYDLVIKIVPYTSGRNNELAWYDYLKRKYNEMNLQASRREVNRRFGYLKKLLELDLM